MTKKKQSDLEAQAIQILRSEVTAWEDATAFITEKVAFQMRNLIRQCRKNFWGVFDEPTDPATGHKKIWVPITETLVEAVVKNIDLDTKDINFRAKQPDGYDTAELARAAVREQLMKMGFGEELDLFEKTLAIDGTAVWKTYKCTEEDGTKKLEVKLVDLLNFYIDPTAHSIQEANAVIERAVMPIDEFREYSGWINMDQVEGKKNLSKLDPLNNLNVNIGGEALNVEVFERWGKMPKNLITGKKEDEKKQVNGHIVVSNLKSNPVVHLIEEYEGLKPYEEAWYTRVPNRWYGRGVAEKVLMLQLWLNTIVNIRINRSRVSQLGLFKIRAGSGITPQMLSRLSANGAMTVQNMDDIQQLVMQEASQASYQDESIARDWAGRVTSAFDSIVGESLPSSTPATNAVLQDRNARTQFTLIKEGLGMFLQRWMNNQALPIVAELITEKDIIRVSDGEDLKGLLERVVAYHAKEDLEEKLKAGQMPTPDEIQRSMEDAVGQIKKRGQLFIKTLKKIIADKIDAVVFITNEELDTAVVTQNLMGMLKMAPQYQEQIVSQVFDLMGLPEPKKPAPPPEQPQPQGMPGGMPPGMPQGAMQAQNPQQIVSAANIPQ